METVVGKRVLVTGAAMGMGRLFAERAVAERASDVVLWDINGDQLAVTAKELSGGDAEIRTDVVDVGDHTSVADAAAAVTDALGGVDVLVNNAGVVRGNHFFWETDQERDIAFTMEVNALGPMMVARAFLPGMIETDGECRLVNLASAAGLTANPRMASYAASKWAVVGWSESVRLELEQAGHDHVRVTTVCPYYVKTGMFDGAKSAPLLPLLEPAEVVDETWRAMTRGRPFVVMPRTVLLSEALKGIVPLWMRDFLAGRVFGIYHTMDDFQGHADQPS
ncbi:MAG TPA: SDR family NAD(P)-dependent oxidoreductase [Nocardioides sp.]|uniref:SDR family NAD(P)-dependent oxidoreductase n=1 Tax=Nocardioides sp. TaxID=35761 RepID=UPI002CBA740D|nr:SDR family NAD(P)-dependent oxidoreductase [Nocardioides sp.]HQR27203.1 SDR family NAD(P)-dependent oxidoreductase [Nocardioides sp.]